MEFTTVAAAGAAVYLRVENLGLSWIGTGRFIFSHNYTDADFADVAERIVRAAREDLVPR